MEDTERKMLHQIIERMQNQIDTMLAERRSGMIEYVPMPQPYMWNHFPGCSCSQCIPPATWTSTGTDKFDIGDITYGDCTMEGITFGNSWTPNNVMCDVQEMMGPWDGESIGESMGPIHFETEV